MAKTPDLLFEYLRRVLYDPANAALDVQDLDAEYRMLGEGLLYLGQCIGEQRKLAKALSKGDLGSDLPSPDNELAAPLKALHASLKHMTWQSQQVAKGDYKQRIDFMGDFADAFNTMTEQLDARQKALVQEIEMGHHKTKALEQSNSLLTNITAGLPQQIFVLAEQTGEILYSNKSASELMAADCAIPPNLLAVVRRQQDEEGGHNDKFITEIAGEKKYFALTSYTLQWNGMRAKAIVLNDVSADLEHVRHLENVAYRDNLTKAHNRFSGMQTLNRWLEEKRNFALCFVDLDNLKYVNDTFGHAEGDAYIRAAAECLQRFSADTLVSRLGGDEFMLLAPGFSEDAAKTRMEDLGGRIQEMSEGCDKPIRYSMSYGVVEVGDDNNMSASVLLSLADDRMYVNKRAKKKIVV